MSGEAVRIAWNGPRISAGASGFGSKRSSWLGAPRLKIRMQFRSSLGLEVSCARSRPGRLSPRAPSAPTWRKSRRDTPSSQRWQAPLEEKLSMADPEKGPQPDRTAPDYLVVLPGSAAGGEEIARRVLPVPGGFQATAFPLPVR